MSLFQETPEQIHWRQVDIIDSWQTVPPVDDTMQKELKTNIATEVVFDEFKAVASSRVLLFSHFRALMCNGAVD